MVTAGSLDHKIWRIAWPAILSNISIPLLGLVDAGILGHLEDTRYLGAVAIGSALLSFLYWGFSFLRMGTTGRVARALGAGSASRASLELYRAGVLALVLALLTIAASLAGSVGDGLTLLMAAAMGAVNNMFQRDGEVSIGVTYMTGALVKLGQALASAVTGGPAFGWLPHLLLWLGLVAGAVAGALLFGRMDLGALWVACGWCLLLLAWSLWLGPLPRTDRLA